MFKLVKWAFQLGQQTERHRMAGILNDHRRYYRHSSLETAERLFGKKNEPTDEAVAKRIEIDQQVERRAGDIIHAITTPQRFEEKHFSLLFPKGGDNDNL